MSWDVTIKGENMPDPMEPVVSFCCCKGSLVLLPEEFGMERLHKLSKEDQEKVLSMIIEECDKGNSGKFNDEFGQEVDQKWSGGQETKKEYEKYDQHLHLFSSLFTDLLSFRGYYYRERTRKLATRFYLYLKAGYRIDFEW